MINQYLLNRYLPYISCFILTSQIYTLKLILQNLKLFFFILIFCITFVELKFKTW